MDKNTYRPGGKDYIHVDDNRIQKIDEKYVTYLKLLAKQSSYGKCMMCFHDDIRKHAHEWINVYSKGTYVRPHFHPDKTETKLIIDGRMRVIIFDEAGVVIDDYVMEKESIFISRIDKGIIHMNIQLTDVVYYEVLDGPYAGKDDSIFPQWAPGCENEDGIREFMQRISGEY